MEETIGSAPDSAMTKASSTGLKLYVAATLCLIFLTTSPFTVGPMVASVNQLVCAMFGALQTWAGLHPFISWYGAAVLSFLLMNGFALTVAKDKAIGQSCSRIAAVTVAMVIGIVIYLSVYWTTPSFGVLYDAIGAVGGVPAVLNGVAAGLVWLVATGPIIISILAFLGFVMDVVARPYQSI